MLWYDFIKWFHFSWSSRTNCATKYKRFEQGEMKEKETINEFQWEKRFDGLNTVTIISLKNTVKGDYHTNPKTVKIWLIK